MLAETGTGTAPLLVNRGFVPEGARQESYTLPDAEAMTGLLRRFERQGGLAGLVAAPDDPTSGSYYSRERGPLVAAFGGVNAEGAVLPFYLDSTLPTEVPRGGTTRLDFSNRHLGYAITWYGLAGGLLLVFLLRSRTARER